MTSITASRLINLRDAFRPVAASFKPLPRAILKNTASTGKHAVHISTFGSRTEQVMANYRTALQPLWRRGYR